MIRFLQDQITFVKSTHSLLVQFILLGILITQVHALPGQTYYVGGADGLWEITITNGNCSADFIGPFTDVATGNNVFSGDIAICPDGSLYITDNSSIWEVDPGTGDCTLAVFSPTYLGIVALGCEGNGILYGAAFNLGAGPILYQIDVNAGTITNVGVLPFNPSGDLHLYGGSWYMSSNEGLIQLDVQNPGASSLLIPGISFVGMTAYAGECNSLLGGDGDNLFVIDLDEESVSALCVVPGVQIGGLTTQAEFDPIASCEIYLDLDEDDSSGAPEADYDSEPYSCLTPEGLPIADEDLDLETAGTDIDFMTIHLVGGNANGADEFLELLTANNITIAGSGTDQITLTNAGGATVADFRAAVLAIRYMNTGVPLQAGDRTIEVQFTLVNGDESNIGVATIPVEVYPDLDVDLGEDVILCQGDVTLLDAGIPNAEYQWSTNETTEQIAVVSAGLYAVTVTDELSCPGSDTVEVFVLPNVEIQLLGDTVCQDEEAVISFISDAGEPLDLIIESTPGGQTLVWNGVTSGYSESVLFGESQVIQITSYSLTGNGEACWINLELTNQVKVNLLDTTYQEVRLCHGETYEVGGGFQTEAGMYEDVYLNSEGCDSLVITDLAFWPLDSTILQLTSCDPNQVGQDETFFTNTNGCDSLVVTITSYSAADTTLLKQTTCDPAQAGTTSDLQTNQSGCDSLIITTTIYQASDTTLLEQTTCDPAQSGTTSDLQTNQSGCDSLIITTTIYQASDTTLLLQTTCDPAQAGTTTDLQTNQSGCDSLIITTTIYQASDTTLLLQTTCDPAQAGTTTDLLTSQSGCDSLVITMTTLLPSTRDTLVEITCQVQDTGLAVINLTNQSGCDSVIVRITEWSGTDSCDLQIGVTIFQPACAGDPGEIQLQGEAGIYPVDVTWGLLDGVKQTTNWDTATTPLTLGGLLTGTYTFLAMDANGQVWQDTITITSGEPFSVDLGPDLQVATGTTVNLNAIINPITSTLESIIWEPNLCAFCLDPTVTVDEEITIRVTVRTDGGCEDTNQVTIRVEEGSRPQVFIPSVFSPNNDGINDLFAPQGDASIRVEEFGIYGRWGERIYRGGAFQLGDPNRGWDGSVREDPAHVDVYVYVVTLRWPDGTTRLYKGDVQIVR